MCVCEFLVFVSNTSVYFLHKIFCNIILIIQYVGAICTWLYILFNFEISASHQLVFALQFCGSKFIKRYRICHSDATSVPSMFWM